MPDYQIQIEAKGDTADVLVYDQIGSSFFSEGLTAKAFADSLRGLGKGIKTINVRINSPGGSVFDGTAIYNTLRNHGAKVVTHIEGGALSIASLIAMAGDERRMASNGYLMIHDPISGARGSADDLRKTAEMLDKVKATMVSTYAERSGRDAESIAEMMGKETWLTAAEAKELGFVDAIAGEAKVVAMFDPQMFANVPAELLSISNLKEPAMSTPAEPKPATLKELKAACLGADNDFLVAQMDAEATVAAAQTAWMAEQSKRLAQARADLEAAKNAPPASAVAGVDPLPAGGAPSATAGDFWGAVSEFQKEGLSRQKAIAKAVREQPDLHKAMLASANK